ncbi:hypothetical protein [Streptomyces sp. NPDC003247]|uniref:hypothetical protein n=1 Tax=Streptomyces sp. NPDC003247 TaxID=3364677 RepID=UPI0036B6AB1A
MREQFEPVPDAPGLFRLTDPERDGPRRARQAVHDLRHIGYAVHADYTLATVAPTGPRLVSAGHRSRPAQAAARRSPQQRAPATSLPSARPLPPRPAYAPTVHLTAGRPR